MGLVLILTGGAVVVLKAYHVLLATRPETLAAVVVGLRQQAAVVATLAGMVFLLLDALEKGKVATSILAGAAVATAAPTAGAMPPGFPFGRPTGLAQVTTGT